MTDQIYYKVQYPIKKAISNLKEFDPQKFNKEDFTVTEIEKMEDFIYQWENGGKEDLTEFIRELRGTL
ncbi:MAG: hypothetical protein ACOC4G_13265 [Bacillota bacterium]